MDKIKYLFFLLIFFSCQKKINYPSSFGDYNVRIFIDNKSYYDCNLSILRIVSDNMNTIDTLSMSKTDYNEIVHSFYENKINTFKGYISSHGSNFIAGYDNVYEIYEKEKKIAVVSINVDTDDGSLTPAANFDSINNFRNVVSEILLNNKVYKKRIHSINQTTKQGLPHNLKL
jgi:hypothetical protein